MLLVKWNITICYVEKSALTMLHLKLGMQFEKVTLLNSLSSMDVERCNSVLDFTIVD